MTNNSKDKTLIRLATNDDMEAVADIYNQAIDAGRITADMTHIDTANRIKWLESHPENKYPVFVAEMDSKVVGWLSLSAYRPGREALDQTAEISYYIDYNYHGHGIGSQMVSYAIERCPDLNLTHLLAIIIDGNAGSVKLIKKFGFKQWGQLPGVNRFDDKRLDHLYYGLDLSVKNESQWKYKELIAAMFLVFILQSMLLTCLCSEGTANNVICCYY